MSCRTGQSTAACSQKLVVFPLSIRHGSDGCSEGYGNTDAFHDSCTGTIAAVRNKKEAIVIPIRVIPSAISRLLHPHEVVLPLGPHRLARGSACFRVREDGM